MHTIRDENAKHFEEIVLFPDYTSSGIWCSCGLGSGNPEEVLPLSNDLIKLVQFWNDYWDMASERMSLKENRNNIEGIKYIEKEIINIGRILREQIADIIPCELLEDRCKLNITDYNW